MEAKGDVKHIALMKFKDDVSQDKIDQLIKSFGDLVNIIPLMKAFQWGLGVSSDKYSDGFTHVFESTFESMEGLLVYQTHPAHVEFGKEILPHLEKFLMIDYEPKTLNL